MLATIINCIAIIVGGLIGTLSGNRIKPDASRAIMKVMGLITFSIGIKSTMAGSYTLMLVFCLVLGTVIGMLLKLDDRINGAGDWAKNKLAGTKLASGQFGDAFVSTTILFGVGTMTVLGSINAGLSHDYSILLTKSTMDFVSAIAFSAALGSGVIFSAVPILIIQGSITLLAGVAEPLMSPAVVNEMSAVGGAIFIGMSANLLELGKEHIKVGDMLPAIFLPVIAFPVAQLLGLL